MQITLSGTHLQVELVTRELRRLVTVVSERDRAEWEPGQLQRVLEVRVEGDKPDGGNR